MFLQTHLFFFQDCSYLVMISNTCNSSKQTERWPRQRREMQRWSRVNGSSLPSKHLSHPSSNIHKWASSLFTNTVCSWHQFPLSCLGSPSLCFFLPRVLPLPAPVSPEVRSRPLACLEGAGRSCRHYLSATLKR